VTALVNVGDTLAGKYKVDRILGIGGMGMVVAATHLELDQRVAIKFMLPDALANEQAMGRFIREAKAAVKLKSEHICRVLDVGKLETGAPYIVMELMDGEDFAQLIRRRGPLPITDAVDLLMQSLEGLADAHANQIVAWQGLNKSKLGMTMFPQGKQPGQQKQGTTPAGDSSLITSAPSHASSCEQVGPACTCVMSRMRTPLSASIYMQVSFVDPKLFVHGLVRGAR